MSNISKLVDDLKKENIREYAKTLEKLNKLRPQLEALRDKLIQLSLVMSNDDINTANELYERKQALKSIKQ